MCVAIDIYLTRLNPQAFIAIEDRTPIEGQFFGKSSRFTIDPGLRPEWKRIQRKPLNNLFRWDTHCEPHNSLVLDILSLTS